MISLLLIGGIHFVEESLLPDLRNLYVPTVIAPIVLAGGVLLGYKVIRSGGNLLQVIVAGAILGLLPVILEVVGFGMILGRGVALG